MTVMFSGCYVDGFDALGSSRLDRTKWHLEYYRNIKEELGLKEFILVDNGSDLEALSELNAPIYDSKLDQVFIPHHGSNDIKIYRFENHLERVGIVEYPYCWRNMYFLATWIIHRCHRDIDKIFICDSDAFVVSKKLAHFIRDLESGFTAMWSEHHRFPASELSILCKDRFIDFINWTKEKPWGVRSAEKIPLEVALPYSSIQMQFVGDRYGEFSSTGLAQTSEMDFYAQARMINKPVFDMEIMK